MRKLLPQSLRRWARRSFDRCFCRSDLGLERIGGDSAWWVVASRLGPGANVLSGGAGQDISFELELVKSRGCRVALFDPSPTGAKTYERTGWADDRLAYHAYGLDASSQSVSFVVPRQPGEGSYGLPGKEEGGRVAFECLSPAGAMERARFDQIEMLKIDIEGFEYGFLEAMLDTALRPPQLGVEFHHFLPHISWTKTWRILRRLRQAGYRIAHKDQCDFLLVHESVIKP